jgi:hypothetical protein
MENYNLLVMYAANSVYTPTVYEHIDSFRKHTDFNVHFVDVTGKAANHFDLDLFDVIVVHYSVRICLKKYMADSFVCKLIKFNGPKVLFIQDEYDNTEQSREWIEQFQFDLVYTCVPASMIENVYPASRFPKTQFINNLTGYVSDRLRKMAVVPLEQRECLVGYRGRALHPVYGRLGMEKQEIGVRFKALAVGAGLPVDIEWEDDQRIYGEAWFEFLSKCKATLATESGSNVFDIDGELRKKIDLFCALNPGASFDEIASSQFPNAECQIANMEQISPKVFEAIALGTALVMYEGRYSDIVTPWRHYIPLKKDFSNFLEVIEHLKDDAFIKVMTETARREIVESVIFSYARFMEKFEIKIGELLLGSPARSQMISSPRFVRHREGAFGWHLWQPAKNLPTTQPLNIETLNSTNFRAVHVVIFDSLRGLAWNGMEILFEVIKLIAGLIFIKKWLVLAQKIHRYLPSGLKNSMRPLTEKLRELL